MLVDDVVVHIQREPQGEVAERHARRRQRVHVDPFALGHGGRAALQRDELLDQRHLVMRVVVVIVLGAGVRPVPRRRRARLEGVGDGGRGELRPVLGGGIKIEKRVAISALRLKSIERTASGKNPSHAHRFLRALLPLLLPLLPPAVVVAAVDGCAISPPHPRREHEESRDSRRPQPFLSPVPVVDPAAAAVIGGVGMIDLDRQFEGVGVDGWLGRSQKARTSGGYS